MSNPTLRKDVLRCFKHIHRTRQQIFNGDDNALEKGRLKINEEFKKNKHITEPSKITELIKLSESVEHELRTTVIQAEEVKPGIFRAKITPETLKLDNVPFKDASP